MGRSKTSSQIARPILAKLPAVKRQLAPPPTMMTAASDCGLYRTSSSSNRSLHGSMTNLVAAAAAAGGSHHQLWPVTGGGSSSCYAAVGMSRSLSTAVLKPGTVFASPQVLKPNWQCNFKLLFSAAWGSSTIFQSPFLKKVVAMNFLKFQNTLQKFQYCRHRIVYLTCPVIRLKSVA